MKSFLKNHSYPCFLGIHFKIELKPKKIFGETAGVNFYFRNYFTPLRNCRKYECNMHPLKSILLYF